MHLTQMKTIETITSLTIGEKMLMRMEHFLIHSTQMNYYTVEGICTLTI